MPSRTEVEPWNGLEVAIIGMAGRFPGARELATFWQNLCHGVESIRFFTDQELLAAGVEPRLLHDPGYVKARGTLEDIALFDAAFFGVTPKEAEIMDPQHRLFLECAWEALENAGYSADAYSGTIGVYAGTNMSNYALSFFTNQDFIKSVGTMPLVLGNDKDYLCSRVSYKLNLEGPSIAVQTSCSTSLVAVHLACQGLLSGACDMALAGGVSISVPHQAGYWFQQGGISSPDGHCRAFDAAAQGTASGSGVGLVTLKRLADALQDGDSIIAVIKGSAINNDGASKIGYTAPRVDGQARVIRAAHLMAEVDAATITYVEAHGTGTALGDPIEVAALTRAFRASTAAQGFCALGSVKTNIGHLDAAAGIAGLLKTTLALHHKVLPPSLHFQQANPQIDFAFSPFYVNTTLAEWPGGKTPRRAGVSSFGIGGTNAHVVLEEAPPLAVSGPSRPWQLLLLSAQTATALEAATANLLAYGKRQPDVNLADVAYTLQVGRKAFRHRRALVCDNLEDTLGALERREPARLRTAVQESEAAAVVFMFPGQGTQYVNMGLELYQTETVFRDQVEHCATLLAPHLGLDLRQVLYPDTAQTASAAQQLRQTAITQPALFVVEYALAQLWMAWGLRPQALIGHSLGEYVAACLAGVLTPEDALALVVARGRLMQHVPAGAMLAVALAADALQPLLSPMLSLAAHNGPTSCVVAGASDEVAALEQQLQQQGVACRQVPNAQAFHSPMMEPILEAFTACVARVTLRPPQMPYISNVTGTWITAAEATAPQYWARHLRHTVRFTEGLYTLGQNADSLLLEVGPGKTLSALARRHPAWAARQNVIASLPGPQEHESEVAGVLHALGQLWLVGVEVNWANFSVQERRRRLPLPTYPFERQRYWVEPSQARPQHEPVPVSSQADMADWFCIPSWQRSRLSQAPQTPPSPWLVLADTCGVGAQIVHCLQQQGQEVTTVVAGEQFTQIQAGVYSVHPQRREDYEALLRQLHSQQQSPTMVLHCWSVTPDEPALLDEEAVARAQNTGFYSLLLLAQAFTEQQRARPLHIVVVSNNMHDVTGAEVLRPEKATLLACCKVFPLEYPNITCRSIDIALATAGTPEEKILLQRLIAEINTPTDDTVVAYRGPHRWVQTFTPLRLDSTTIRPAILRDRGVYLITGGLGGIGLLLAEYLARTVQAKLVLTGRTGLPPRQEWEHLMAPQPAPAVMSSARDWVTIASQQSLPSIQDKIRKVQELEQLGSEVLVLSADVSKAQHMQSVVRQTAERFGDIHGVIHTAAIAGGGLMQLQTPALAEKEFAPKIGGTLVLEALGKQVPLDFLVLCSSSSSITGGAGQVSYCAANAFLDAFAHARAAQHSTYTVAINWDRWSHVGMAIDIEARHKALTGDTTDMGGMTPGEGVEAFQRILSYPVIPQIIVSTQDFQSCLRRVRATSAAQTLQALERVQLATSVHPRPSLGQAYIAPRSKTEQDVAAIWQEVFGIAAVGIYDDFLELGGESLIALQLLNRLRTVFQVELSLRRFFETPTVAGLSEAIIQAQGGSATVAPVIVPLSREAHRSRRSS